jgi:hypothetical protein
MVELWLAALSRDWNGGPKLDVGTANGLQEVVELAADAAAAAGIYCLASALSLGSSVASRCGSGLVEG